MRRGRLALPGQGAVGPPLRLAFRPPTRGPAMPVRVAAKIDEGRIEDMPLTLSFTMTVAEWRRAMRQTGHQHPGWEIGVAIAEVLGHIATATQQTATYPAPPPVPDVPPLPEGEA